jgi:hypothetical protein
MQLDNKPEITPSTLPATVQVQSTVTELVALPALSIPDKVSLSNLITVVNPKLICTSPTKPKPRSKK